MTDRGVEVLQVSEFPPVTNEKLESLFTVHKYHRAGDPQWTMGGCGGYYRTHFGFGRFTGRGFGGPVPGILEAAEKMRPVAVRLRFRGAAAAQDRLFAGLEP